MEPIRSAIAQLEVDAEDLAAKEAASDAADAAQAEAERAAADAEAAEEAAVEKQNADLDEALRLIDRKFRVYA